MPYPDKLPPFSVLMTVYEKLDPDHLLEALTSVVHQSLSPDEIVLVRDGPLGSTLEGVLSRWLEACPGIVHEVALGRKAGSAAAFQTGLLHCAHPLVARMDSDDVCVQDRFLKQAMFMDAHPEIDVLGGWVLELGGAEAPAPGSAVRRVPEHPGQVAAMAPLRCPVNHPTVMYRKEAVVKCGGYESRFGELADYHLWAKMLLHGAGIYNLPQILVKTRASRDLYRRRGGLGYARVEMRLMRELLRMGFVSFPVFLSNTLLRLAVRLLPTEIRCLFYARFLRS